MIVRNSYLVKDLSDETLQWLLELREKKENIMTEETAQKIRQILQERREKKDPVIAESGSADGIF